MKQATVSLVIGVISLLFYGACAFANGKKLKPKDLLSFAMWCGAMITGGYMVLSALHMLRVDEESYRFYVGIFGSVLMLWSLQTALDMLKLVLPKRQLQGKVATKPSETEESKR